MPAGSDGSPLAHRGGGPGDPAAGVAALPAQASQHQPAGPDPARHVSQHRQPRHSADGAGLRRAAAGRHHHTVRALQPAPLLGGHVHPLGQHLPLA
ncbi:hypothetical protein, partial [Aeromonas hydrophila]|uniref:hypothetical protein n=1 Tax=Aeromonas hydrophila TaxID=644 RepID=UPI00355C56B2